MEEPETFKTQILVDGDMSEERAIFLMELGFEEERLDYKENVDFSTKPLAKKSKINLVCDLVSMANTNGGYLVFGVSEIEGGKFKNTGVSEECIKKLTPEDLSNFIGNYIDTRINIRVRAHTINKVSILLIYVAKSNILIPFKRDGQYNVNGENETKFLHGDIFVRHGPRSQKANYEDLLRFVENIREDERKKVGSTAKGLGQIASRLDRLVEVFGKENPTGRSSRANLVFGENNFDHSNEEIEANFIELFKENNNVHSLRRIMNKGFVPIKELLKEQESNHEKESRNEILRRQVPTFLNKLIPIWVAVNASEGISSGQVVADRLYQLFVFTFSLKGSFENDFEHVLYVQTEIVKLVYCLGAISVYENRPDLLPLLIERKGDIYGFDKDQQDGKEFWFRYVTTWLFRRKEMIAPGLVKISYEHFKDHHYLLEFFDASEELEKYMAQFDFLQCLITYLSGMTDHACWPAFMMYERSTIEPIIIKIIESHREGIWVQKLNAPQLMTKINELNNYDWGTSDIYYRQKWSRTNWTDKRIPEFLEEGTPSG